MVSAGEIQPALPHEAPAATPLRSTTVTSTPRSCRNHAVDNPTIPAPITIADRGPPSMRSTPTITHLHCLNFGCYLHGRVDLRRWIAGLGQPDGGPLWGSDKAAGWRSSA